jgi:hypothetical protein
VKTFAKLFLFLSAHPKSFRPHSLDNPVWPLIHFCLFFIFWPVSAPTHSSQSAHQRPSLPRRLPQSHHAATTQLLPPPHLAPMPSFKPRDRCTVASSAFHPHQSATPLPPLRVTESFNGAPPAAAVSPSPPTWFTIPQPIKGHCTVPIPHRLHFATQIFLSTPTKFSHHRHSSLRLVLLAASPPKVSFPLGYPCHPLALGLRATSFHGQSRSGAGAPTIVPPSLASRPS